MNKNTAIQVLDQALNLATTKGVFNLNDVNAILSAFNYIKHNLVDQTEDKVESEKVITKSK